MDADDTPVADALTRNSQRVAIALAAPDRDHAHPRERLAEHRDFEQLRLREEIGDSRNEGADQRMVDPREVVRGQDAAAVARDPVDAIGRRRCETERDRHDGLPGEPPEPRPIVTPQLREPEPRQRLAHGVGGVGDRSFSSSRSRCSS